MKKRIFLLGVSILAIAGGIYAAAVGAVMHTTCGKQVTTVSPAYFNYDMKEYDKYAQEINHIYCGEYSMPIIYMPIEVDGVAY